MKHIQTVLGDIRPEELGVCDSHDHLLRTYGPELAINDWYKMDSISAAEYEFQDFLNAGGKSMVCMDPIGAGRDIPKMKDVAEHFRGKGHLIMATGFHKGSLYDNRGHWSVVYPRNICIQMISREVTDGMDRYSYIGPYVERTNIKAGVIKAGTSMRQITSFEQNVLAIVARAQVECGAPISTHTDFGTMGMETISILKKNGADIEHCIICHTNKTNDKEYFIKMLDQGVNLSFEGPDRPEWGSDVQLAENIKFLIDKGYDKQILLAMDAGRTTFQKGYMKEEGKVAHGISYLLTDFIPLLRTIGISDNHIKNMLINNPARVFSIE